MNINATTRNRASPAALLIWLAASLLALAMVSLPTSSPSAQAAEGSPQLANALTEASLVYVQVEWAGYLVVPEDIQVSDTEYIAAGTRGPVEAVTSCSGFVASSAGDIVTAGHCVDAESVEGGKGAILDAIVSMWSHADGQPLTEAEQVEYREIFRANAEIEGADAGSPPERTVQVIVPAESPEPIPANVVDVQPFEQGDVALLNVSGINAPALPLAEAAPENGDAVVAAGYSGGVAAIVDSTTPVSFKEGSISGTQTVNGAPFTEISAEVSPGMSGGPVVSMTGEVLGTVSWAPTGTEAAANFITDVDSIRSLLEGNGVENTLSEADQAYRQGLVFYFEGRYRDAVEQFDQALELQPGLTLATEYREKAIANYPNDVNPPSSGTPWWTYVLVGLAVAGAAGAAGFHLMRRRRARAPAPAPVPETVTPVTETAPTVPVAEEPVPERVTPALPRQVTPTSAPLGAATEAQTHHFCPNCGAEHVPEAHYCEACGQPLAAAAPAESERG